MPLNEVLIRKIQADGALSFHDVMEMALYDPEGGYHNSERNSYLAEKEEDTPGTGHIFTSLLARQLEEMWKVLDKTTFTIVEYGSGHGTLCRDIFAYFKTKPELYKNLHYCIIEKDTAVMRKEKQLLCEEAEWFSSIDEMSYAPDCILSNEVVDNFAVHEVVMQKELMEVFVDYRDGFTEILKPASQELKDYLREMNVTLPPGYRTEINMEALQWLRKNADALDKGFVVTIDHGFPINEYFSLSRCRGHLLTPDISPEPSRMYEMVGQKELRSPVNFTALHHWGRRFGLECCGYTSQAHFLHGLGLLRVLDNLTKAGPGSCKEKAVELYRKIMRMSSQFNILVQRKGLTQPILSGLQFAKTYV